MKKQILLFLLLIFAGKGFSQTTAYPVPDMVQCNNEVFDLTTQIPITLANQDPLTHTVTFFGSEADAVANTGMITNPQSFIVPAPGQTVFIRVQSNDSGDYDITSFEILLNIVFVLPQSDVTACASYTLPPLTVGEYYTGPGGTGTMLSAGTVITQTMTIYVVAQAGFCMDEDSFTVTIGPLPIIQPEPILACNDNGIVTVNLTPQIPLLTGGSPDLTVTFYTTEIDMEEGINPITNPEVYQTEQQLPFFVYATVQSEAGCINFLEIPVIDGGCTDNVISGHVSLDTGGNGCTSGATPLQNIGVLAINGNTVYQTFTDSQGNYTFANMPDGLNVITPVSSNFTFTPTPTAHQVTMPGNGEGNNFCLAVPAPVTDVAVMLMPVTPARPGFYATYSLIIVNNGNHPVTNALVNLYFPSASMTFASAFPAMAASGNTLTYTASLQPFQSQVITINFLIMTPPTVNGGDVLTFAAVLSPVANDAVPNNDTGVLTQTVINSYDPNDIAVREGEFITEQQAQGYLHYTIRFQNIGDADAINVRIESMLDAKLDASTFEPLAASHNYNVVRTGNNLVFRFNNINLPGSNNEPESHGYVIYRVKPVSTVQLGDVISANADIYFDFNQPIATNTATTTIQALNVQEFTIDGLSLYPNPAAGTVNLKLAGAESATVYVADVTGKTVLTAQTDTAETALDIAALKTGVYFLTVTSGGKSVTKKLLVK